MSLIIGFAVDGSARAVDIREFVHETQQSINANQQMSMVWWIPPEFWDVALAGNPNITPKNAADIRAAFDGYQLFAIVRAGAGIGGLTTSQTPAELMGNARFLVEGKAIQPLAPEEVPPAMQTMLGAMRPLLSNMLGQLGQNMVLVVYPGMLDGHPLIDPLKSGSFQYSLYDQTFHWRMPLASLLPKRLDPKTHEEFPGNYVYNPYTGDKLSSK